MNPDLPVVWVGGLPIAALTKAQSARLMIDVAKARRSADLSPFLVTSANGQVLSVSARDLKVRRLFEAADLIHADGMPLVIASRLKCAVPLPERVATTDLFHDVAKMAEVEDASFYFLGSTAPIVEQATRRMRQAYPRLRIVGSRDGYFSVTQEAAIIDHINAVRPDVLWIGMGVPREQDFAVRNRHRFRGVGVIKTAGGLFDCLSGSVPRAPLCMQSASLEWL